MSVDGQQVGQTGPGLMILVCAMQGDDEHKAEQLAAKVSKLRIFKDDAGKMNRSVVDVGGSALVISQFTLAADTSRGNIKFSVSSVKVQSCALAPRKLKLYQPYPPEH